MTSSIDELLQAVSGRSQPTEKGLGLTPTVLYRLDHVPRAKLILECEPSIAHAKADAIL